MRLMIYMGATVYYRLDPICGYLVSFSRFFAPPFLFVLELCPARSNTFPFRKLLRASFDPHE